MSVERERVGVERAVQVDRAGQRVDRVLGARDVLRPAAQLDLEFEGAAVARVDREVRRLTADRVGEPGRIARELVFRAESGAVVVHHGLEDEIAREVVHPGGGFGGREHARDGADHVSDARAVEAIVLDPRRAQVVLPVVLIRRRVEVAVEHERRTPPTTRHARDHVRPTSHDRIDVHPGRRLPQLPGDVVGELTLPADRRRIEHIRVASSPTRSRADGLDGTSRRFVWHSLRLLRCHGRANYKPALSAKATNVAARRSIATST